jgi:hypothetical protein
MQCTHLNSFGKDTSENQHNEMMIVFLEFFSSNGDKMVNACDLNRRIKLSCIDEIDCNSGAEWRGVVVGGLSVCQREEGTH